MTEHPELTELSEHADGSGRAGVAAHVSACPDCAALVTALARTRADLDRTAGALLPPMPPDVAGRIAATLAAAAGPPPAAPAQTVAPAHTVAPARPRRRAVARAGIRRPALVGALALVLAGALAAGVVEATSSPSHRPVSGAAAAGAIRRPAYHGPTRYLAPGGAVGRATVVGAARSLLAATGVRSGGAGRAAGPFTTLHPRLAVGDQLTGLSACARGAVLVGGSHPYVVASVRWGGRPAVLVVEQSPARSRDAAWVLSAAPGCRTLFVAFFPVRS